MSQRRLGVLLTAMVGLIALRWWSPPTGEVPVTAASAAVTGPKSVIAVASTVDATKSPKADPYDVAAGTRDAEGEEPRNAFAVRVAMAAASPPPTLAPPHPFEEPAPPPPPSPPPFTVIGSWRDEHGASVFIAGPRSVQQGRVGDVLLSEFRITQITPRQVLLKQSSSNREIALPIPAAAGSALTPTN